MRHVAPFAAVGVLVFCAVLTRAGETAFKPDADGFIRNWLRLEVIQLDERASNHDEYSQKQFFNKEYYVNQNSGTPKEGQKELVSGTELTWKALNSPDWKVVLPDTENALSNVVTYIVSPEEVAGVKLKIGSDDGSMWTFNGNEVIRVYAGRPVEKDQNASEALTLRKGLNVLRARVINGAGACGFCARFVDRAGKPVTNLTITQVPPK